MNDESINTAYQLLQTKTAEIKKMVEPSMDGIIQGGNDKLKALISRVPGGDEVMFYYFVVPVTIHSSMCVFIAQKGPEKCTTPEGNIGFS